MIAALPILAGMALFALVIVFWLNRDAAPVENSSEAGFARDMIVHHSQAVEMTLLLYDRTDDPTLRSIALDMLLAQQNQIGQMQGWLYLWNIPIASTDLPMTWMGMPTEGLMPGMATDEQIVQLRASTGSEADRLFIQLMIPHHQSGIHMAEAIINQTNIPAVQNLARSVIESQQREIDELELILAELLL
ncbi:MAG: DUF305 domain-containing protein [Anaerolineae bacterium]|nr:DUF305 domain-containing protein [Anaerolineae bacterium]